MGGLAVGNADGPEGNAPLGTGHAFLYNVAQNTFFQTSSIPGSTTTTAYGIWYNGGTSYTICRRLQHASQAPVTPSQKATWSTTTPRPGNSPTGRRSATRTVLVGHDFVTHFEGISSAEKGVYTLSADSASSARAIPPRARW